MRLVYLGTPAFAVPTLERAVEAGHEVLAVFTQPDRPKGRGQKDAMPPVKEAAVLLGLPVHQPERIRKPEAVEQLRALAPDAMVVVGYGQIIPQAILDIPPQGIINVHASLLPKYRGAAPIQWAIARGETRTGVTTMKIDAGLDTGDMLLKWETEIGPEETAVELGGTREITALISLGPLDPSDVVVQLVHGQVGEGDEIIDPNLEPMTLGPARSGGDASYTGTFSCSNAGRYGYTVRVLPCHPGLVSPVELGRIAWA